MNALEELQNWYLSECNEDWEHSYGVKIETLDNPGWSVTINLEDTYLETIEFTYPRSVAPLRNTKCEALPQLRINP